MDAKIPIEQYHRELLILAGFAHDYAIVKLLSNSGVGKQVREGYLEVWKSMEKQNAESAALLRALILRCPEYAKAAEQIEPGTVTPIGLVFGGFLAPDNGTAQILALTYAPAVYFSHFEGTVEVLRQARLIKAHST